MDTTTKPTLQGTTILFRAIVKEDVPFTLESTRDEESNKLTGMEQTFTKEQIEA